MTTPCQSAPDDASGNQTQSQDVTHDGPTACRSDAVRRVVQLVEFDRHLVALCSDGSIWTTYNDGWKEIAPPPGCGGGA